MLPLLPIDPLLPTLSAAPALALLGAAAVVVLATMVVLIQRADARAGGDHGHGVVPLARGSGTRRLEGARAA